MSRIGHRQSCRSGKFSARSFATFRHKFERPAAGWEGDATSLFFVAIQAVSVGRGQQAADLARICVCSSAEVPWHSHCVSSYVLYCSGREPQVALFLNTQPGPDSIVMDPLVKKRVMLILFCVDWVSLIRIQADMKGFRWWTAVKSSGCCPAFFHCRIRCFTCLRTPTCIGFDAFCHTLYNTLEAT